MEDYIDMPEIIERLRFEKSVNPERSCREWLARHGVKQFRRGGIYVREQVINAIELEKQKCLVLENVGKPIISGERCVLETKRLQSKNTLLDFVNSKMQESMHQNSNKIQEIRY